MQAQRLYSLTFLLQLGGDLEHKTRVNTGFYSK